MRKVTNPFDCRAFGQAVKDARTLAGLTRAQVEEMYGIDARYLLAIGNTGQHMSLQVFYELATIFGVSVDRFFFPGNEAAKDERRLRLDSLIDCFDSRELAILEAAAQGIHSSRTINED